jgi:hypothetical protein
MTEGGDEAFYSNFEALGYNKAMQLDQAVTPMVKIHSKVSAAVSNIRVTAHDGIRETVVRFLMPNFFSISYLFRLFTCSYLAWGDVVAALHVKL